MKRLSFEVWMLNWVMHEGEIELYIEHEDDAALGDDGENDDAFLVAINVTYGEGIDSDNPLDSDVDSNESCHRDKITNEALWSDNEQVFEVRRQIAKMKELM
ncbi:hypothetical protein Ancab_012743 [Ancistrocladus abbreviatus]